MIIKTDKTNILLDNESILRLTGIKTDKYVLVDTQLSTFMIEDLNEYIVSTKWEEEEFDGRKLRKIKKEIIYEFGERKLKEYKEGDGIFNQLKKKFINVSEISDILKNSINNDMNTVVWGFGGYGKSEMITELFSCPELKDRVFIKSFSEATTEDDLFGGINLKKMQDTGVIEYIPENSFANKEIVIFEEAFDANPRVLAALKDTLTAKEIRNGNQRFELKTKIIIALTNKSLEEVILDNSTEALIQRFPVSYELQYPLSKLDVISLVLNRYKDFNGEKLSAILNTMDSFKTPSPRKVLEMAKYIKDLTVRKNRRYMEKITNTDISPVLEFLKHKKDIDYEKDIFEEISRLKAELEMDEIIDYDSIRNIYHKLDIVTKSALVDEKRIVGDSIKKMAAEISLLIETKFLN